MITIRVFDPKNAAPEELIAGNHLDNQWRAERLPDDPPTPIEETQSLWQTIPPIVKVIAWQAWTEAGEAVASAHIELITLPENRHVAQGSLYVAPAFRRKGLGSRLFAEIMRTAADDQRSVFIIETVDRIPAGQAFAQAAGMQIGLATHVNQLDLNDVDRSLLQAWQQRAAERAAGYELLFWDGPYPEDNIEEIANMVKVMNQAPRGDLDVQDFQWTPEMLRQMEESFFARRMERWTLAARQISTRNLAGFTEILWNPSKPTIASQGGTGVLPEYRNLGLGRWLKAAMLEKVLTERPQTRFVRTGNADSNEPMLNINNQLGFRPYMATSVCQVSIEQGQKYLANRGL